MAAADNFDSTDPFQVLGLDPSPSLDKKEIKRAYKRLAIKYHPDITTSKDSPAEEKRRASDRFAKINWAYETLSGKNGSTAASSSSTASSSATGGWTPPHRRKGPYASSSSSRTSSSSGAPPRASTDWRDYIPNYQDDDNYDAGGDSFGAIFSDLFAGAAGAAVGSAASGAGVFKDFLDFLESTVDGYDSSSSGGRGGDAELQFILQAGTLQEIGEEMDETDLVVQQLNSKLKSIQDELVMLQAELSQAARFTEKLSLEERIDELQARNKVAEGYLKKARNRLLALQTRYKQLIVYGDNDSRAGGSSQRGDTSWDNTNPRADSSFRSSRTAEKSSEDSWDDGFGSFGRGRGSSRRRASRRQSTVDSSAASSSSAGSSTSGRSSSSNRRDEKPSQSRQPSSSGSQSYEPPHRRTTFSSTYSQREDDNRRLRELKVEEEFDKLKRDLGL